MARSLPRGMPADQQVDPAAILGFLDAVDGHPDVEMHSLMVVRHGRVVAEGWWAPYSADRPQLLYSLSKIFTSTATAFAQAEGLLDLDDTVVSHFAEFDAGITDPRSRSMKVRHVASMASGHTREMLGEAITREPAEPIPAARQGYGFQFWMARHGYRGDGAFGQFCVILPEHETVIVTTAYTIDMQAVLDAMWTHLLPGLGTTAPDVGSAQDQLSARLDGLELPASHADPAPADGDSWTGEPFTIAASAEGIHIQPALASVEVAPKAGGWQISLTEPANTLTFPVGTGAWAVSAPVDNHGGTIPVAASGGWLDDHTLRAEIIFLETPHRMDIACSLQGRTGEAVWRHPPLAASKLQDLHCPR